MTWPSCTGTTMMPTTVGLAANEGLGAAADSGEDATVGTEGGGVLLGYHRDGARAYFGVTKVPARAT